METRVLLIGKSMLKFVLSFVRIWGWARGYEERMKICDSDLFSHVAVYYIEYTVAIENFWSLTQAFLDLI